MLDLELLEINLSHNDQMRKVFEEIRASFKGRTDEDAIKVLATCDRNEANINGYEEGYRKELNIVLQRLSAA